MTLTEEIKQLQDEVAEYRAHVPELKKALDQALAELATLERRLDISERYRSANAARVGALMSALDNVGMILNDVISKARQDGFKPEPVERVVTPTPAAPEHGGGAADDGREIPQFLTEKDLQEPKGG